jgi:hypothetical protein
MTHDDHKPDAWLWDVFDGDHRLGAVMGGSEGEAAGAARERFPKRDDLVVVSRRGAPRR